MLYHCNARWAGDNGALDVCEIGARIASVGEVITVKILGAIGVERESTPGAGVTDWKLLVIDVRDERAAKTNDLADLEPGLLHASLEWLQLHELPDGRSHTIVGGGRPRERALEIARESHSAWRRLVTGATPADGLDLYVKGRICGFHDPNSQHRVMQDLYRGHYCCPAARRATGACRVTVIHH